MTDFRYAQFCPLARASEILGERWTPLVIRELLLGPQRFSDLRRRLPGLSSSVLSGRLRHLEDRGLVARRELPPPAAASVFELTPLGRGLEATFIELTRWGLHLMEPPRKGDHFEPSWIRLGLYALARRSASPARKIVIEIPDRPFDVVVGVVGGRRGTRVSDVSEADGDATRAEAEAVVRSEALPLFALLGGDLAARAAVASGAIEVSGDLDAVRDLPALFELAELGTNPTASVDSRPATRSG